jgi:hypothetical protein
MTSKHFARADWRTRDQTNVTPAKLDPNWYKKSEEAQRRAIEKISGTYRIGRSPTAKGGTAGIVIATRGSLKDKVADAPANILITAADKAEAAAKPKLPSAPLPLPIRAPSPRRRCEECNKDLPYNARDDARFCCEAHRKAFGRRKIKQETFDRAFKDYKQPASANFEASAYRNATGDVRESAARCGIEADFIATPGIIVTIHDMPSLPLLRAQHVLKPSVQVPMQMQVTKGNLTTDNPDVIALLESVGADHNGPERSVTLYQFEIPHLAHVAIPCIRLRFQGDPGTGWDDGYDPPDVAMHPRDVAMIQLLEEADRREINKALKARVRSI